MMQVESGKARRKLIHIPCIVKLASNHKDKIKTQKAYKCRYINDYSLSPRYDLFGGNAGLPLTSNEFLINPIPGG
jgi:hypothetical protein